MQPKGKKGAMSSQATFQPIEKLRISETTRHSAGRAIEKGFGRQPVFTREGGSIPVVSTFQEELGLPAVLFGVGLPDENAHAPNEKLDVSNFHNGVIASAYLYEEIAKSRAE